VREANIKKKKGMRAKELEKKNRIAKKK